MAATFNPKLISPRDIARQRVGDTNVADDRDVQFPDETYDALLALPGATPLSVAAQLMRDLGARAAAKVTTTLDDQRTYWSDLSKNYYTAADRLYQEARLASAAVMGQVAAAELGGGVYVGGLDEPDRWRDPNRFGHDRSYDYGY